MSGPIAVRLIRNTDVAAVSDVAFRAKQSNGYDDVFMDACRDELTVTADEIACSSSNYWVAETNARIVGVAGLLVEDKDDTGEVHFFFIDPDHQRCGIGRLLWQPIIDDALSRGLARLVLDADPNAVPFYRALGFDVIGESPSASIPGRSLPHMARDL